MRELPKASGNCACRTGILQSKYTGRSLGKSFPPEIFTGGEGFSFGAYGRLPQPDQQETLEVSICCWH